MWLHCYFGFRSFYVFRAFYGGVVAVVVINGSFTVSVVGEVCEV